VDEIKQRDVEVYTDLGMERIAAALERIANVLEQMYLADATGEIVFTPAEDEPIRES
jgi:hypothetical protein